MMRPSSGEMPLSSALMLRESKELAGHGTKMPQEVGVSGTVERARLLAILSFDFRVRP
jgi:hypothetical protein